jgi:hypothetical protein
MDWIKLEEWEKQDIAVSPLVWGNENGKKYLKIRRRYVNININYPYCTLLTMEMVGPIRDHLDKGWVTSEVSWFR